MRRAAAMLLAALAWGALATAGEVAWHEGDVASAFDRARAEGKPLFLYWGAVWCPPCNQIKTTVFSRAEFADKMRLFVPVYLDGDTESAQAWGEKLGAQGYPTMLVLSPEGREVLRLPTGLQPGEFLRVLDEALDRVAPIEEVLASALAEPDPGAVPDRAYRLLAYYSWDQAHGLERSADELETEFRALAERVPERLAVERSRLYLRWLQSALDRAGEDDRPTLPRSKRAEADRRLREILAEPPLLVANAEFVTYAAGDVLPAIHPKSNKARRTLAESWLAAASRLESDPALSIDERISAWIPALEIHELQHGDSGLPDDLERRLLERVAWVEREARDPYTRQAALSTAGYVLRKAGLTERARELYLTAIETSESPYYFMSSLATMASDEGRPEDAVTWLARAYEGSRGRATRFQWGTSYLLGLMRLTPDDATRVRDESRRVFSELLGFDDAFAGRNRSRIGSLAKAFREWNADGARETEIASLRGALLPACDRLADAVEGDEDSPRDRCAEFFRDLGAE